MDATYIYIVLKLNIIAALNQKETDTRKSNKSIPKGKNMILLLNMKYYAESVLVL